MPHVIPPPPPVPSLVVNTSVSVTPHQAWSAAVQNIVIAICVTVPWVMGKIDTAVAVPVLLGLSGLDLVNRLKARTGAHGGAAALAFGATGALSWLGKLPHVGAGLLAALTALGLLNGCAGALDQYRTTALDVVAEARPVAAAVVAQCAVDKELTPLCEIAIDTDSVLRRAEAVLLESTATEDEIRAAVTRVIEATERLAAALK